MDIVNFDGLKAQGKVLDILDVDPNEDYFLIGKFDKRAKEFKATNYPIFAIKAGDVMGGTPTLQQVLDFNHDLVDNNNFQGTSAGVGNIGGDVIASGFQAALNNEGNKIIALGANAANGNKLSNSFIISNNTLPSYANFVAASAAITVLLGASTGSTYLYHDQATNSIGAVRL